MQIAQGLRQVGFEVRTLADAFTELACQRIPDPTWIAYAVEHDLVIFTKDDNLLVTHREIVLQQRARLFVLPHANLSGADQVDRYAHHRFRIALAAQRPGPHAYRVYPKAMKRVAL